MGKERINDEFQRDRWPFYQEPKMKDCNPTAIGKDILTNSNRFVTKKNIDILCDCVNRELCRSFLESGDIRILDKIS